MAFIHFLWRYKYITVFCMLFVSCVSLILVNKVQSYRNNKHFTEILCPEVIGKFVSDKHIQTKMMYKKINIGFPGPFYRDVNNTQDYDEKLRKEYIAGNYLTFFPYASIQEFNDINSDNCTAKKVRDKSECYYGLDLPVEDGDFICVFFKYKIKYLDQKGNIKLFDTHSNDASDASHTTDEFLGETKWDEYPSGVYERSAYTSYGRDSGVVFENDKKYRNGHADDEWKIIEWIVDTEDK